MINWKGIACSTGWALMVTIMTACQGNSTSGDKTEKLPDGLEKVELDNGKKWKANPETKQGIVDMVNHIGEFVEDQEDGYETLAKNLRTDYQAIFKNCTMTGEAHNQLHHYLVPIDGYIKGIESADNALRETNLDKLEAHLAWFPKYFETAE